MSAVPPVRVLHLIHNLELGGAQGVIRQLVRHTDSDRFAPEVVSLFAPLGTEVEEDLSQAGVPVHYLGKRPGLDPRTFFRLGRLLRQRPPAVLHSHCYGLTYAYPVARWSSVLVHVHTMHTLAENEVTSGWQHRIYARAFRSGVVPVAVIEEVRASLGRVYGLDAVPFIPNGVSIGRFRDPTLDRDAWRRAQGFAVDDLLFVCVARLNYPKNQAEIIEAFAPVALSDARPVRRLLLVGDGPDRGELERQARDAGLVERVHFLGSRSDVPVILHAADAFVLFSSYEGNPLSVMEAMASGLPVVSSAVGGIPDLLDDGAAGLLVPSGDRAALTRALHRLVDEPGMRVRLGAAAAHRAAERFSAAAMAAAYARLYDDLLAGRRPEVPSATLHSEAL